jgi:hypothetical protein
MIGGTGGPIIRTISGGLFDEKLRNTGKATVIDALARDGKMRREAISTGENC